MENKRYIENNDDKQALELFLSSIGEVITKEEEVLPMDALGRITSEVIFAQKCDPTYNAAAMDGIAVVSENTHEASENTPFTLHLGKDFVYINTGGIVGGKYNAVIMIEDVINIDDFTVKIISPTYPWQNVRVIGESVVSGQLILPSKHSVTACDIGAVIASGNKTIKVFAKPKVGIIPTGAEMVDSPDELTEGKLMESNSKVFSALTINYGGQPKVYPVVEDDIKKLKQSIVLATKESDVVLVNAGSSAGTKDFTVRAIEELGKVIVHGIAIKPGKPTILGIVDNKPVIGIPGYPVSAYLVYEMFVKPVIGRFLQRKSPQKTTVQATLTRRIVSSFKNAELIRMTVGEVGGKLVATPLDRGASAIMSLVKADGLFRIERLIEGVEAGANINIELIKTEEEIKKALVITGSHDMIIDVIADAVSITSAHVGSMGGISALLRGECHIAPIHLLDAESGVYNDSYIKKYFAGKKMALVKGVGRVQGLIVPKGNPKNIKNIADIKRLGLSFANRQRGAGTRILFDYFIEKEGINENEVFGYEKEYSTHLAVAVAVKNNVADCGMAVLSAAKAIDTDFIPLGNEEYDFLIPYQYIFDKRIKKFVNYIKSKQFADKLNDLGGYTFDKIGEMKVFEL